MLIHVSPRNPKPMYEQVIDEMQRLIAMRMMQPNEMLPSIRELSKELKTSGITIRRAYQELEQSGFIYTRAGKGSFVTDLSDQHLLEWKMQQVEEPLDDLIQRAKTLGLTEKQFLDTATFLWKSENKDQTPYMQGGDAGNE